MKKLMVMVLSWIIAAGAAFAPAASVCLAYAAEAPALDQTKLLDDLDEIDLSAYPKNESGTVTLLNFAEFGYAQIPSESEFGIYLYVYNPSERELSERVGANMVNMAVAYDATGAPTEYANLSLTVIDRTDNFRFYKFRVTDGAPIEARAREYAAAHGERRYDVVGIQLWGKGSASADEAEDNAISATYYFSGYAAGMDAGGTTESSLTCRTDKLETVPLQIHSTYYRQDSINENGAGHHNQLSSVYFAIPKDKIETYGMLYAVKCSWDERRTTPIIVTNRQDVYTLVNTHLGISSYEIKDSALAICDNFLHTIGGVYNYKRAWGYDISKHFDVLMESYYAPGYSFFFDNDEILNVQISSVQMKQWISDHGFADYLFADDVDEGRTYGEQVHTFYADEPFDMTSFNSSASGWDKFVLAWQSVFGGWDWGEDVNGIEPIKYVTDEDFSGTDSDDAERLFINDQDYSDFKTFYNTNNEKNDVFLLRFAVTDYYANMQYVQDLSKFFSDSERESTYLAEETVFLNFDIIELTFKLEDGTETVLGVVADPIDIIAGIDPPRVTDNRWWIYAVGAIGILAGIMVIVTLAEKEAKK